MFASNASSRWQRPLAVSVAIAVLLGLGACAPLTVINTITPDTGYTVMAGLSYTSQDGDQARHRADVYLPTARRGATVGPTPDAIPGAPQNTPQNTPQTTPQTGSPGAAPVLVFFYGGNWRTGDRADYRFVAAALAARGVIVVVPDYRLYPAVRYEGILDDSAQAVAWALKQTRSWGGDPQRVYVGGHSAGAYNAAMLALDARWLGKAGASPHQLAGLVGLAGPYNFLPIQNPDTKPVFSWPNTPPDSQPIHHVSAQTAPQRSLLIAAGKDDVVDPAQNTEALAQALRQAGAQVELHRHARLGHATTVGAFAWPLRPLAPVLDEVSRFLLQPDTPAAVHAANGGTQKVER